MARSRLGHAQNTFLKFRLQLYEWFSPKRTCATAYPLVSPPGLALSRLDFLERCRGPTYFSAVYPTFLSPAQDSYRILADQFFFENCPPRRKAWSSETSPNLRQLFLTTDIKRIVETRTKWLPSTSPSPKPAPPRLRRLAMASRRTSRGF